MYKVIVKFKDKHNGKTYHVGDIVKFSQKRAKEILEVGNFIEKVEEPTEKK